MTTARKFMLDTDTVSFALRGQGEVGSRLVEHAPSHLCLSAISLAELRFGADRRGSKRLHRLIDTFAQGAPQPPSVTGALSSVTPREREVLLHIAAGLTNAEIASALGVTTGTVKTHVTALLAKLGLRDRVQATILAYESGLVRPSGGVAGPT